MAASLDLAQPSVEALPNAAPREITLAEHTLEIVSDSGEGAQKCGQIFGAVSAKMGNGVWTVEIIPAEIQPPPRVPEGASGIRIRIGARDDHQLGRRRPTSSSPSTNRCCSPVTGSARWPTTRSSSLEDKWATHDDDDVRAAWTAAMAELSIAPVPHHPGARWRSSASRSSTIRERARTCSSLGMLAWIYGRDLERDRASRSPTPSARSREDGLQPERRRCWSSATTGPSSTSTSAIDGAGAWTAASRWSS